MPERLLEICTGDPEGVRAALAGGADRVELCSGLSEGGLTPSAGVIRYSARLIPTNVLIRPRPGDFVYSEAELSVMEADIDAAVAAGASGIVIGVLTPDGDVDVNACRRLLAHAQGLANTFHRAFDVVADPFRALDDIISLGFSTLLTSGQQATALDGASLISAIHSRADGRIAIMAGAGVNPSNAAAILRLSHADALHASARAPLMPACRSYIHGGVAMGSADTPSSPRMATSSSVVAALRDNINNIPSTQYEL